MTLETQDLPTSLTPDQWKSTLSYYKRYKSSPVADKVAAYANEVIYDVFPISQAHHQRFLGSRHWDMVASASRHQMNYSFSWYTLNREKKYQNLKEVEGIAQSNKAAIYTLDDYIDAHLTAKGLLRTEQKVWIRGDDYTRRIVDNHEEIEEGALLFKLLDPESNYIVWSNLQQRWLTEHSRETHEANPSQSYAVATDRWTTYYETDPTTYSHYLDCHYLPLTSAEQAGLVKAYLLPENFITYIATTHPDQLKQLLLDNTQHNPSLILERFQATGLMKGPTLLEEPLIRG